jgi:hypothetical protein
MNKAAMSILALALVLGCSCSKKGSSRSGEGSPPEPAGAQHQTEGNLPQEKNSEATEKVVETRTPESVGAVHLTETGLFPEQYRKAAEKVAKAVDKPEEFYSSVEEKKSTGELVFHLWHQDAFKSENKNVVGNPGGKCRDVHFDPEKGEVSKALWWQ